MEGNGYVRQGDERCQIVQPTTPPTQEKTPQSTSVICFGGKNWVNIPLGKGKHEEGNRGRGSSGTVTRKYKGSGERGGQRVFEEGERGIRLGKRGGGRGRRGVGVSPALTWGWAGRGKGEKGGEGRAGKGGVGTDIRKLSFFGRARGRGGKKYKREITKNAGQYSLEGLCVWGERGRKGHKTRTKYVRNRGGPSAENKTKRPAQTLVDTGGKNRVQFLEHG